MKAVLMALVMTIRASSDIWVSRCFPLSISRFWQVRWLNGTMRKHRSRQYIPFQQSRPFGPIESDGDYGSGAVLKSTCGQLC